MYIGGLALQVVSSIAQTEMSCWVQVFFAYVGKLKTDPKCKKKTKSDGKPLISMPGECSPFDLYTFQHSIWGDIPPERKIKRFWEFLI